MNVETITMDKAEAADRLQRYRERMNRGVELEYQAAAEGYAALAEGKALLDIDQVLLGAPLDERGRPRLALARADAKEVRFFAGWVDKATHRRRNCRFVFDRNLNTYSAYPTRQHEFESAPTEFRVDGYALVPMMPPDVAPPRSYWTRYHILWEVERWADSRRTTGPDIDPYLLRHLHGSLFVIEAAWDLTELERAIMQGRAGG